MFDGEENDGLILMAVLKKDGLALDANSCGRVEVFASDIMYPVDNTTD